ncbi:MAG: class I SAM-dependent methyltransferase [Gammaproteobacteria bacterium]|nr:class I SAM-dependent methyltransferase [Gammaproteobacteria bacterium]
MISSNELTAKMEPFDSFWEGPQNIEKGYGSFYKFYKHNYLKHMPEDRNARILVISCGPGYFVNMLNKEGYANVLGIDSYPEKIVDAKRHGLNCESARAFEFLEQSSESFDAIFCEQELNHLTKEEMLVFVDLCWKKLREGGRLITHGLNGANPITGSEALAQNFDHYNTFTEYTFRQVLEHSKFEDIKVYPLNLYVFWTNPLNYVLIAMSSLYTLFFRVSFIMYGKSNKIFTKKIGSVCRKGRG